MFIYSLPLVFSHNSLGRPIELLLIVLTLFTILYISTPYPQPLAEHKPLKSPLLYHHFLYSWTAQLSLERVFWMFFILLNLTFVGADYAVKSGIFSIASWMSAHFIFFFPSIFWTVAVWRSSENTTSKIFAAFARLTTISVFFEYGLKIYIYKQYPQEFFNCEERFLDFLICF